MVPAGLVVLLLAGATSPLFAQESAVPQARPGQATSPAPTPTPAETRSGFDLDKILNVRFDVTLTYSRKGVTTTRSATITVAADGYAASFRSGTETAVPSVPVTPAPRADGSAQTPVALYSYRSSGFNVDVDRVRWGGRSRVMANVKVDWSDIDLTSGKQPSFPTFRQTFSLVLESGKSLEVVRSRDVFDGVETVQTIEIKATILM